LDLPDGATPREVLAKLGIRRDTVLVFVDQEPFPDDAPLPSAGAVRIVRVVSGGSRVRHALNAEEGARPPGGTDPT
jgi:sulfur carrier protein ThiS